MKIKYNKSDNFFKLFEDSYYIAINKDKIKKNKKYPFYNNLKRNLLSFIGCEVLFTISEFLYATTGHTFYKIMSNIIMLLILAIIFLLVIFIYMYLKNKKKDFGGILLIDEKGITDDEKNWQITFKWECVSYIIIGKYSINIFLKNESLYLRFPIIIKEQLLEAIEKYSNVEVINLNIND